MRSSSDKDERGGGREGEGGLVSLTDDSSRGVALREPHVRKVERGVGIAAVVPAVCGHWVRDVEAVGGGENSNDCKQRRGGVHGKLMMNEL